jgi:hypothetical protein
MMEAKLRQMESTNPKPKNPDVALLDMDTDLEGIPLPAEVPPPASSSMLPQHPSLPMKPPPTIPDFLRSNQPTQSRSQSSLKEKSLLPPLPLPASIPSQREKIRDAVAPTGQPVRSGKPMKFIGIKVGKAKPKEKEKEKETEK